MPVLRALFAAVLLALPVAGWLLLALVGLFLVLLVAMLENAFDRFAVVGAVIGNARLGVIALAPFFGRAGLSVARALLGGAPRGVLRFAAIGILVGGGFSRLVVAALGVFIRLPAVVGVGLVGFGVSVGLLLLIARTVVVACLAFVLFLLAAAIVTLHITVLTLGVAMVARRFGLNLGIRHN